MNTLELSRAELWFCAPNTPAIGEAQLRLLHTGRAVRRVWVRLVPSRLAPIQSGQKVFELFLQEETEQGKSAVLRRDGTLFWSDAQREDNKNWRKKIGKMLSGRTSRAWRPDGDQRFGVVIYNSGEGAVCKAEEGTNRFEPMEFSWGKSCSNLEFARWPQAEFDSHFDRQFADPNSPLRLAYEWHGLNNDERTERVTRCESGSWDEMRALAQCVLVLIYELDDDTDDPFRNYGVWDMLDEFGDPFTEPAPPLEEWVKTFRGIFRPLITRDDAPNHERAHLSSLWNKIHPHFPPSEPSAHEKLEAHLRLREWVMEHAPDEAARLLDFSRLA